MSRLIIRLDLPDVLVAVTATDPARWIGVYDGDDLVAFAPLPDVAGAGGLRQAALFVPVGVDATRLRVVAAEAPAELAVTR